MKKAKQKKGKTQSLVDATYQQLCFLAGLAVETAELLGISRAELLKQVQQVN